MEGNDNLLNFLALTRSGLNETELHALAGKRISRGDIAGLLRQLRPYLYSRDGFYTIRCKALQNAILFPGLHTKPYSSTNFDSLHKELADYFRTLPLSERKTVDFYYHYFLILEVMDEYFEKIHVLFGDLDLFRLAWELDRDSLREYYRTAIGGESANINGNSKAILTCCKCPSTAQASREVFGSTKTCPECGHSTKIKKIQLEYCD